MRQAGGAEGQVLSLLRGPAGHLSLWHGPGVYGAAGRGQVIDDVARAHGVAGVRDSILGDVYWHDGPAEVGARCVQREDVLAEPVGDAVEPEGYRAAEVVIDADECA